MPLGSLIKVINSVTVINPESGEIFENHDIRIENRRIKTIVYGKNYLCG